jgi:hypothetical protein
VPLDGRGPAHLVGWDPAGVLAASVIGPGDVVVVCPVCGVPVDFECCAIDQGNLGDPLRFFAVGESADCLSGEVGSAAGVLVPSTVHFERPLGLEPAHFGILAWGFGVGEGERLFWVTFKTLLGFYTASPMFSASPSMRFGRR